MKPRVNKNDKPDYGKVIFAPDRKDVPKPPEPNTPEEKLAWDAFQKHYFGGKDTDLNRLVDKIVNARDLGWYTDFLKVPSKYKLGYRIINDTPAHVIKNMIPGFDSKKLKGWVGGGNYKPHKLRINSWTVSKSIFFKLLKDFGGKFYRNNEEAYHVLFVVSVGKNKNNFFMNPDKYTKTPKLAGKFSYQKEIISIDSFSLVGASYCRTDEFNGNDTEILKYLLKNAR